MLATSAANQHIRFDDTTLCSFQNVCKILFGSNDGLWATLSYLGKSLKSAVGAGCLTGQFFWKDNFLNSRVSTVTAWLHAASNR